MEDILEILENNARVSLEDLAKLTNRQKKEVQEVVEKYEKEGVIVKYKAVINRERLNEERVTALIEVMVSPQKDVGFDSIAERIYRFSEVKSCYLLSGTYDLLLIVEGKDIHTVASFVAEKLAPLSNVKRTVTHFMLKKYKEDGVILVKEEKDKRLTITY
ncbi:MAG: AsnC family transcriptional regulator [Candidatus Omnitrophica bacterium 4484_70.1]|nr:MAG: AsnC family transcriptional regulator [Candidatus Omnitrophica bacterium 4484_70.1]